MKRISVAKNIKIIIRGIALDLEGTVVNIEPAHHWGWIKAAAEIGVTFKSPEEAMEKCPTFSGGPERTTAEQICALIPGGAVPTEEQINALLERKWAHYDQLIETVDLRPRPGFLEVYGKFRKAELPVAIGTAVKLEKALPLFRQSGLDKLFTFHDVVFSTDVENPKPAPDCFLKTAARMKIKPEEQLVFEDSPSGVKSGVAAGSPVVGIPVYDTTTAKQRLIDAGARRIFTDWRHIDLEELLHSF